MNGSVVRYCQSCGAALNVEMNRAYIFCQYCGAKNVIASETMKTNINVGGINIQAKTDIDSLIASAEYAISINQLDKANEMLVAAIMSGTVDHRIFVAKAKIDLLQDNNKSLFDSIHQLRMLEARQSPEREVTRAVFELMRFRGMNGVTVLHNATFHELYDIVVYCVEHGSDVNCIAGMNRVSPISIMFVPVSSSLSGLDGTPFVRNPARVKAIRDYLMAHGAQDCRRRGY
ncbi:MAG: hypothetical protein IJO64_01580 [Clostridia bacterium]|nr:hypothetical protein [Clostridia bacterium]MBQ9847737.1 hypothetical protein [Clostridia bacterium]